MKEQLQKDFYNSIKNLSLSQKDIEIKKFCLDKFIDKGFPNRKEEDWKFSDLNQIIKNNQALILCCVSNITTSLNFKQMMILMGPTMFNFRGQ